MKNKLIIALITSTFSIPIIASGTPKVVGIQPIEMTVEETAVLPTGVSAKKSLLNHDVYNAQNQKIGKVNDMIVSPDKQVSFIILGAGGFLGFDQHDVAIPFRMVKYDNKGRIVIKDATKAALLNLPKFRYNR